MAHQKFFIQQKALINKKGKVLVLINPQGQIDFPGGRVDESDGNNLLVALNREIKEEVDLEVDIESPFIALSKDISHGPTAGEPAVMIGYRCQYIAGEVKLSDEHERVIWVGETTYQNLDRVDEYFPVLEAYFRSRQSSLNPLK